MDNVRNHRPVAAWRNRHLWYITAIVMACSVFYYLPVIIDFMGWQKPQWGIFYAPHDLQRLLFFVPVLYAVSIFRVKGLIVTGLILLLIFFPHAVFISTYSDALLRSIGFLVGIGGVGILVIRLLGNITERKQTEEKLWESEERLSSFMESAIDGYFLYDSKLNYVYINKVGLEMYGLNKEEIIGKNILDIVPGFKETGRYDRYMEVIKIGKSFFIDDIGPHPKFGDIHLALRAFKVGDGLGVITTDITERKEAEESLHLQAEIAANMSEGVYLIRVEDGIIAYTNPKFEEMFGYDPGEMVGKHVSIVNAPTEKSPEEAAKEIMKFIEKTGGWRGEIQNIKKDGTPFWCYAAVSLFDHPEHGIVLVSVHNDITERKQAEEKEKQLQQELYFSSRLASMGELAAGVAHELNNPLTGIIGFSQRLLRKSTDEAVSRDLERVYGEAQRAARIIQNLLTFARRHETKKEHSNINDIVQKALELRVYELKTSNIEVVADLTLGLPTVIVDFQQVQEVFLNIILNAEQVMTETKGGGKLCIKTQEIKGRVQISFTDDGPGIPKEHLNRLFDPFFTTRGEVGGTGLGLSVCHGIITEHGGRIYAKSKLGKGATFVVELPLTTEHSVKGDLS